MSNPAPSASPGAPAEPAFVTSAAAPAARAAAPATPGSPAADAPAPHAAVASGRCRYQEQDSTMTLREGVAEYAARNPFVTPANLDDPDGFFAAHDSTHVLFGTTTSVRDEALNDLWTLFGVEISLREYARQAFAEGELSDFTRDHTWAHLTRESWEAVKRLPALRRKLKAMTRKWPWRAYLDYADTPLRDIRREFGVRVFDD